MVIKHVVVTLYKTSNSLTSRIEVDVTDAQTKILPGTWVFHRKITPDGTVQKFKARYCVRDDLQEGDFNTYAPLVAWSTVRLFLVFLLVPNFGLVYMLC